MALHEPIYLSTYRRSLLNAKIEQANSILRQCTLCPRQCTVDRTSGSSGYCQAGLTAQVAAFNAHFGEELPLIGNNGSGTIFFSHCSLRCLFCQNFEISHLGEGYEVDSEALAGIMLTLQQSGCHNINLVSPTHFVPQILNALAVAIESGLSIPLVYNTSGYERIETLKLLDGVIDIYLPDFKFWSREFAQKTCQASDYPLAAGRAIKEMYRQVGDLIMDDQGIARHGLMIRHLVMPEGLADTAAIMRFIADEVSTTTYVNIMSQYRPMANVSAIKELSRPITATEFHAAVRTARRAGLTSIDR